MKQINKERLLGSTIVAGLTAGVMMMAPAAYAQTTSTNEDEQKATQVEEVVVVGSRIRRDVYNNKSPSPVQVVTSAEATMAGFVTASEVLQSTAIAGGTSQINNLYGGYVTNGGPGANTLSLRGMGANRTLVLLNGRRVAPAGSRGSVGSADLNVIPSALIERIEVLRDGASSIYGSDAVAGVVNIITKKNFDGVTIDLQRNMPMDIGGAGATNRFAISAGGTSDRGYLMGSFEYLDRDDITYRDLAHKNYLECPRGYWNDGSDYVDPSGITKCWGLDGGGVTINTLGTAPTAGVAAWGNPTLATYNRWRPNSSVATGLVGYEGVSGGSTDVRDTYEDRMLDESLYAGVRISTAYLEAGYDLGILGNAEVYGEFLFNRRETAQIGYRQLSLDYFRGSPLIPAAIAALPAFSLNQGLSPTTGPFANANVQARAFVGFGLDESSQQVDFTKIVGGIRGDLIADWRYDVAFTHTKSRGTYVNQMFITNLLQNSLDVVAAPAGMDPRLVRNGLTCRVNITDPTNGCISAPALSSAVIGGQLPQDWVDYFFRNITGTTEYTESVFSAGFDGPVFTLPAGQVSAFVGVEWREMEIDDTPSVDMQRGNILNYSSSGITRGTDSVKEIFGEIEVPLLANLPLAQALTLNASARYTDYDSYGDDTTYKVGLLYTPVNWLSLRSTYGTSYRAPALYEMYLAPTSGFVGSAQDRCNEWDAPNVNPNRAANCASEGLPAGFTATSGITVLQQGGITSGLAAETSENFTVGLILQPQLPASVGGDFSFSIDYYEIEVNNGVATAGYGYILNQCYDSAPSDFAARAGYCALISRNPASRALTVNNSYVNLSTTTLNGIDYNARYRRDIGSGTALFNFYLTQYLERTSVLFPTDVVRNQVGSLNQPEFAGTFDASYTWDNWNVRYGVEYTAGTNYDSWYEKYYGVYLTDLGYIADTPDYFTHSISAQYRSPNNWVVTAGIRNLLNEDLPLISAGLANRIGNAPLVSNYDPIGRSGFINFSKSF